MFHGILNGTQIIEISGSRVKTANVRQAVFVSVIIFLICAASAVACGQTSFVSSGEPLNSSSRTTASTFSSFDPGTESNATSHNAQVNTGTSSPEPVVESTIPE